ncbi:hypothetical protein THOG05_110059 [Vibrio rotiferianus]|nr:hypothetical protein THOG05_110059 [Vibrio rotiferianus]CAH1552000.1 hypothetical protein THOE12_120107 [Vibrio rotiferianus]CAH1580961.1 hypothetical protein THOG10_30178 [Vibrio rotiferianus]CAH1583025.1 hypothetical protein THOB06_30178 [Vibrio rotiferianus]
MIQCWLNLSKLENQVMQGVGLFLALLLVSLKNMKTTFTPSSNFFWWRSN